MKIASLELGLFLLLKSSAHASSVLPTINSSSVMPELSDPP